MLGGKTSSFSAYPHECNRRRLNAGSKMAGILKAILPAGQGPLRKIPQELFDVSKKRFPAIDKKQNFITAKWNGYVSLARLRPRQSEEADDAGCR